MRRIISFLILVLFCFSCSFDNKSGIWKDDAKLKKQLKKKEKDKKLKNIFSENISFNEEVNVKPGEKVKIDNIIKNIAWTDKYFNTTNNIPNAHYNNEKYLVFKSSKLSRNFTNPDILYYNNNIISYDHKGTIFIYSNSVKKKIFEYNFYKKKYKRFKKQINIVIDNSNIYVSDNLGYIYCININSKKLIWAKRIGIPFRSNIKVANNKLFLADQDNKLYSFKTSNGEKIWQFATTLTDLKSSFKNNIVIDVKNSNLFFLNTSGELYSINYLNQGINWFSNLKMKSLDKDTSIFFSSPLILKDNHLIASDGKSIFKFDSLSGSIIWAKNISTNFKGVLTKENLFLYTSNNLLICLDLYDGKVIWSKDIFKQIENLYEKKVSRKIKKISHISIADNELFIFSKEGYLLTFNYKNGQIETVNRILKSGLKGEPIFGSGHMYSLDNNNRLFQFR